VFRVVTRASLALILGCGAAGTPPVDPLAPEDKDRESWDVRLQLRSATSEWVTVEAPYLTDHIDAQQTRADSGVTVTLADSTGAIVTRLSARRLVVDHRAHTVALAGSVTARSSVLQVTIRADTMIWDRTADRLKVPDGASVTLSTGRLAVTDLSGGSDLAQWTAQNVQSTFRDTEKMKDEIRIDGRTAHVKSDSVAVMAHFDSVKVYWRGRDAVAQHASYDGKAHRLLLTGSVALRDSGRHVSADTVTFDLSAHRITARGAVRATGDLRFDADQLREDESGRWTVTGSPVRLEVDDRRLEAGRITLSADMDTVAATGGVSAIEGDRSIHADSLLLIRAEHRLDANGTVRVIAADMEGTLRADHLRSTGVGELVYLWGGAHLRRTRDGEDLTLAADTLRLDRDAGRLTGTGAFVLRSPPRVNLRAQIGTYLTSGDTATLAGQAEFLYAADGSSSRLTADTCHVILVDGEPVAVDWPGRVEGRLEDAQQTSWLRAQAGHAELTNGRLFRLTLQGDVEVMHRGTEGRLSRFTAASMELNYGDDGVLHRVRAEGDARVRTRLPQDGDESGTKASFNEVAGQRLEVDLDGGAVVVVRVLDAIEGHFMPADEEQ
jgi:lipopolysaccharide export system protein LptA